jgi:transcriptional regulator with XRE-family HTH domain
MRSASGGRGSTLVSTLVKGDPLVPRLLLGRRLRDLREARGMTRAEVGRSAHLSVSKLTRIEHGRNGLRQRDLAGLLATYGVHDEAECATLVALAEQTNARPWWHPYRDAVPNGMGAYLSAEDAARLVRRFEDRYVPELLHTGVEESADSRWR